MAYDTNLYIRSAAASNTLWTGASATTISVQQTGMILLPGVPLRGLNVNVVVPSAASTPTLSIALFEAVSTGGAPVRFRTLPNITTAGDYNFRFALDPTYYAVGATITVAGSSGATFGQAEIRIGMDLGAGGNAQGYVTS